MRVPRYTRLTRDRHNYNTIIILIFILIIFKYFIIKIINFILLK